MSKFTPAKRAELMAALAAYKNIETSQTGAQSDAGGLVVDRKALVKEITAERMQIQFAAEAE